MNLPAFIGIAVACGVVWFGVIGNSVHPQIFLDPHAILIVLGGTVAAALIGFPIKRLIRVFDFLIMGVLFRSAMRESEIAIMVVDIAVRFQKVGAVDTVEIPDHAHPFLNEAKTLFDRGIKGKDLRSMLDERIAYFMSVYLADAKMLNALAKFPPAFGLLGASAGMIAMMSNLGSGNALKIGPAMAVALVATFWGIGLANLVILPLADHAMRSVSEDSRKRKLIAEGVVRFDQNLDLRAYVERLAGFMNLDERANFYEIVRMRKYGQLTISRERGA